MPAARMLTATVAAIALAAFALAAFAPTAAGALDIELVNRSGQPGDEVYVMLHGDSSADGKLPADTPRKLASIPGREFRLDSLPGGRILFSYDSPVTAAEPPRAPVRYDKVELSLPGVANLTAVDFFAIPFKLEAFDDGGDSLGKLAFQASTGTIKRALLGINRARGALVKTEDGAFARILSPQLDPRSYPSFRRNIESMAGRRVILRGAFYGAPYQEFVYSGRFEADGTVRLTGTITAPNGGTPWPAKAIRVGGGSLRSAIYTVNGPFIVGNQLAHVSDNNVYSVIYRDLISGFAWGYMGGRYGNDSGDWAGEPPFAAARATPVPYATFNEYAAVIYRYSDAYGFSFSDTGPKPVQLPLDGAKTLRITIKGDG